MSWWNYKKYVPVSARRADAGRQMAKLKKAGQAAAPVVLDGKKIASTFWGKAWCSNLESYSDFSNRLPRGRSYVLAVDNQTAWHHPIHLHGYSFRVITRNGRPTKYREWRDTMLIPPRERAEIAFVADNPGDWMFHCHILDHQEGGMMSVIRVT